MRETILNKYKDLKEDLFNNYNKIKVIDNYDFYLSSPYTILYLNKHEDFNEFKDLWNSVVEEYREKDYNYDDILWVFEEKARLNKFDYIELGTLDIYTDKGYELEI